MEDLLQDISNGKYKKIVVMSGAGISTAAGIPDFRSPKTGLYSNLMKFNLPFPEAVFDLDYLRENPDPFFMLAGEMYPSHFEPTTFHKFVAWLAELGCLKRVYTQNIDTLERRAGVPGELIVEAHGSFSDNHCIDCQKQHGNETIEPIIVEEKRVPRCEDCDGIVKPDIVFFGEALPDRFHELMETDFEDIDLAIIAGTSLQVSPFNQLPLMVPKGVPRYLFNNIKVGNLGSRKKDVLILDDLSAHDDTILKYVSVTGTKETKDTKDTKTEDTANKASTEAATEAGTEETEVTEKIDDESEDEDIEQAVHAEEEVTLEDKEESAEATEATEAGQKAQESGGVSGLLRRLKII